MVRILIVDDSLADREMIVRILADDPELEVVAQAADGVEAVAAVRRLRPDAVTMAGPMLRMDGVEATRRIMAELPTPIAVVVGDGQGEDWAFRAMAAGALAIVEKPTSVGGAQFADQARQLVSTVKLIAGVRVRSRPHPARRPVAEAGREPRGRGGVTSGATPGCRPGVVAVAASTGGPAALARILADVPVDFAVPVLLVQHIATGFEQGLVQWLDSITPLDVRAATAGAALRPGELLVAPAHAHLGVNRDRTALLSEAPPIGGFRPSATFLFQSVAEIFGRASLAVVLTGMGRDGAAGLRDVARAGGHVIAQDEATSVVYGMPKAALSTDAVTRVLPIESIGPAIVACQAH